METSTSLIDNTLPQVRSTKCFIKQQTISVESPYHGKIDWDVAKRFLEVIRDSSKIKRTSLAMKAGVNYGACMRYVSWFSEIGWIVVDFDNEIRLSDAGQNIYERLMSR